MKNKNVKNHKQHKDTKQPVIVIGNMGERKPSVLLILGIKLAFTLLLTIGTVMCFTRFYEIPCDISALIAQTILFVTVYFAVLFLFKKRYVLPLAGIIAATVYYFLHDVINDAVALFRDYLFIQLDSRLLATKQFVSPDSFAYLPRTQDFVSAMNLAMLIFTGVVCLICVLCCYKKFRPIAIIIMWCVIYSASFAAERADYNNYVLLIITAFFGMIAISSSNNIFLNYDASRVKSSKAASQKEKRRAKRESAIEKALGSLIKFGKNSICGILAAVIALSAAFGANQAFPNMNYINVDDMINNIVNFANDVGEYIGMMFSENTGALFNGYFSSDNFLINNNIELNAPPSTSGTPVLKITSDSPESIFLVGDIGYKFTGNSWISIKKKTGANQLTDGSYTFSDDFRPEDIFDYHTLYSHLWDFDNTDSHTVCHINVEYLKNTDIVFNPFMLTNPAYAYNNENITFFGDTILRVADRKNWVKNFEADVTIPRMELNSSLFKYYSYYFRENALNNAGYSRNKIEEILNNEKNYQSYVYDTYLSVPEGEKENAIRLDKELKSYYEGTSVSRYLYNKTPETYNMYVFALCDYLKKNYTYSLTADNSADEDNTVLGKFLFETKQGHCALYASAMVLALREQGIPARYITGFSTGELQYNGQTGLYEKTLTEKELHAWVEVYLDGIGWLAFDPTGGGSGDFPGIPPQTTTTSQTTPPATTTSSTTTTTQTTPMQTTATSTSSKNSTDIDSSNNGSGSIGNETAVNLDLLITIFVSVLSVIAIAAATTLFIQHIRKKNRMRFVHFEKDEPSVAVRDMYKFIMKLFSKTDVEPVDTELPIEFALRIDSLMKITGMRNNLFETMKVIEKAEFSDSAITEQERQKVYKYTEMLYSLVMKSAGRIKRIYLKIVL